MVHEIVEYTLLFLTQLAKLKMQKSNLKMLICRSSVRHHVLLLKEQIFRNRIEDSLQMLDCAGPIWSSNFSSKVSRKCEVQPMYRSNSFVDRLQL